jgi:hypothetical protein
MAASDYVPIFFKNRLHLAGRPQMSTHPGSNEHRIATVRGLICFAHKRNLDARLRQTGTTGKSVKTCPVPSAKIFRLTWHPNHPHNSARLTADEGRSRSSRTCGEMRWTQMAR